MSPGLLGMPWLLGKEPGLLVPVTETVGAWFWYRLCSFQCVFTSPTSQWGKLISHLKVIVVLPLSS